MQVIITYIHLPLEPSYLVTCFHINLLNNTMSSHDCVDEVVARKLHANALLAWLCSAQRTFDTAKDSLRSAKEAMTEASDSLSLAQDAEMEARSYLQGALTHHKRRKTEQTTSLGVYERLSRPASSTEQTSSPPLNEEDTKDQTTRSSKEIAPYVLDGLLTSSQPPSKEDMKDQTLKPSLIRFIVDALLIRKSDGTPLKNNNDVKDEIQQMDWDKLIPDDLIPQIKTTFPMMCKQGLYVPWIEEIAPSVLDLLNKNHSSTMLKSSSEEYTGIY